MRNLIGISLAALLVPFTACAIADSESTPNESAPASASLGVTVSGLSLVSDNSTYGNDLPLTGVASLTRDEAPTCATDADCTLFVDASSCTCTAITVGTSPHSSGRACVINACRGKSAVCQAGQCAVASAPSY